MTERRDLSERDLDVLQALAVHEARESFWSFRLYLDPGMKRGWWQRDAAEHLQLFYEDLIAGRRPQLVIQAPPQHGKSRMIVDFIAWVSGKHPDLRTIYAAFSDRLGDKANKALQRIMDSDRYRLAFPELALSSGTGNEARLWARNSEILEFVDRAGYFRNTTVKGAITGEGLDLGVIDDPIKGREQANSDVVRDAVWDWFTDDFSTRFSEEAGLLLTLTRWHVDDPAGRLLELEPTVKVISYPAIAEVDERHRKVGEPLFPELKSLDFLERMKARLGLSWNSLYQQSPVVAGGNLFRVDQFRRHKAGDVPPLQRRVIYADTAQKTGERNDYSVFQVWGLGMNGVAYLLDQVRDKMEAPELEATARLLWRREKARAGDGLGNLVALKIEDKTSGTGLIQQLSRWDSGADRVPVLPIKRGSLDKVQRANDVLPSIASGLVSIPADAPWIRDFLGELGSFPAGKHDDQVDPLADAITDLLLTRKSYSFEHLDDEVSPAEAARKAAVDRLMTVFGYRF